MSASAVSPGACSRSPSPLARFPEEWSALLVEQGERSFRGRQVFRWIQARGVLDPAAMTDLPRSVREWLATAAPLAPGRLAEAHRSSDDTRKLVVELRDQARVECVVIPMDDRTGTPSADADVAAADEGVEEAGDEIDATDDGDTEAAGARRRVTLCVSTQYGCAMGCTFCASGRMGLGRSLDAGEIVGQVLLARGQLAATEVLRNLVFMGMGEPLHNYDATARALRVLTHPDGLGMSPRRITVSTVGLVPGIQRLGQDFAGKIGLAVSLHAPDDATRVRLIPINSRYPVAEVVAALRAYPLPRRRRITIEYTLVGGVNDRPSHAGALARLLRGLRVKVNLIPLNAVPGLAWRPPEVEATEAFRELLTRAGYSAFVRTRRGDDVAGACGQLAIRGDPALPLRSSRLTRDGGQSTEPPARRR